jgi:nucleoside-diphosphate-sugar epimerase
MPMPNSQTPIIAVVFGGSGFIGRHLTLELLANGYEVHVADLQPPVIPDVRFHICDVRKPIEIEIEKAPTVVFNLAAIHRTPGHHFDEYYETNIGGASNVLDWCNQKQIKKIVFTSSIAVYGPGEALKDESSALQPIHAYGKSKALAEKLFRAWQSEDSSDRSLIICRPAVIFGPGENGNFTRLAKALKYKYFFYPGGRNTIKASGYVKDLAKSLLFMSDKTSNLSATYNFCFPQNYSIGQICKAFQKVAGYAAPLSLPIVGIGKIFMFFPGPFKTLGARLLKLVFATKVSPSTLIDQGFVWEYDLESALSDWKKDSLLKGRFV